MYRLIIADDEQIECTALEHKIHDLVPEVELIPSVYNGFSLLKSVETYRPDIAIVDINMPGLNGLDAIELLKMKNMDLKIIINTSYSDFAYIQKALQLGASDYLLKPGNKMVMANAIRKMCRELKKEKTDRWEQEKDKEVASSLYYVAVEKWLLSLLLGEQDDKCYRLLVQNCPEVENGGVFTAWKFVSDEGKNLPDLEKPRRWIVQHLCQFYGCMDLEYKGRLYLFLMLGKDKEFEADPDYIGKVIDYSCVNLKKEGFRISVGISTYKEKNANYMGGLYEAKVALQEREKPGISFFQYQEEKAESALRELAVPSAQLLAQGKIEECETMVRESFLKGREVIFEDLDALRLQAVIYMIELEQEIGQIAEQKEKESSSWILWNPFRKISNVQEILQWLGEGIRKCYDTVFSMGKNENLYIEKALIYIYENYQKEISLEDAAAVVGITPFYLSRLFKQEKKITFVEILTDVRIRKAIQMLKENKKSITEISQSVGYPSIPYFYRVFKKTTGFTLGIIKKYL